MSRMKRTTGAASELEMETEIKGPNGEVAVVHDKRDREGISLLRIIFPDASKDELEEMHFGRIHAPPNSEAGAPEERSRACHHHLMSDTSVLNQNEFEDEKSEEVDYENILNNGHYASDANANADADANANADIRTVTDVHPRTCIFNENKTQEIDLTMTKDMDVRRSFPKKLTRAKLPKTSLPHDFLRIPSHQALKLLNKRSGKMEWRVIANLERQVIQAHMLNDEEIDSLLYACVRKERKSMICSTVVTRNYNTVGLGMQLREWNGFVYVNSLNFAHTCSVNGDWNGDRIIDDKSYQAAVQSGLKWEDFGPAFHAGVKPGDHLLGVNGIPFLRELLPASRLAQGHRQRKEISSGILAQAADLIKGLDSVVLHILRANCYDENHTSGASCTGMVIQDCNRTQRQIPTYMSDRNSERQADDDSWTTHSNISNLEKHGWHIPDDSDVDSGAKRHFAYYRPDSNKIHPLIQNFGKRGLVKSIEKQLQLSKKLHLYTSKAALWDENTYLRLDYFCEGELMHFRRELYGGDLGFIRQALCVHIVNTFVEKDRLAYTIWVYDVQSGTEWYVPRYLVDFQELRMATSRLKKVVEKFPFPTGSWFSEDESSLTQPVKDRRCKRLEEFLSHMCNLVYTEQVDESTIEVALFVQSFLGCDAEINPELDFDTEVSLKRSLQLYTYRLFLLPTFKTLISNFIRDVKHRAVLIEENKIVSVGSNVLEKEKIIIELTTTKHVFVNIWELVVKGCLDDVSAICTCSDFSNSLQNLTPENKIVYIEGLFREVVEEQIEIEIYVPLRSIISRLLVHGWRYDDRSIAFKIEILKQKNQSFFNIKVEQQSPSEWQSVIDILSEGVGRSTLPCNKLKAIVNAGKEIGRLGKAEHPRTFEDSSRGADDLLPIFIFCVVNAHIERPCALCALLKHLQSDVQEIGEVGYYLSSFEATIIYIHEMDLTDTQYSI